MKAYFLFVIALTTLGIIRSAANGQPGSPSVFALDPSALERNKSRVNAKDAQIMPAYKLLLKDADK